MHMHVTGLNKGGHNKDTKLNIISIYLTYFNYNRNMIKDHKNDNIYPAFIWLWERDVALW